MVLRCLVLLVICYFGSVYGSWMRTVTMVNTSLKPEIVKVTYYDIDESIDGVEFSEVVGAHQSLAFSLDTSRPTLRHYRVAYSGYYHRVVKASTGDILFINGKDAMDDHGLNRRLHRVPDIVRSFTSIGELGLSELEDGRMEIVAKHSDDLEDDSYADEIIKVSPRLRLGNATADLTLVCTFTDSKHNKIDGFAPVSILPKTEEGDEILQECLLPEVDCCETIVMQCTTADGISLGYHHINTLSPNEYILHHSAAGDIVSNYSSYVSHKKKIEIFESHESMLPSRLLDLIKEKYNLAVGVALAASSEDVSIDITQHYVSLTNNFSEDIVLEFITEDDKKYALEVSADENFKFIISQACAILVYTREGEELSKKFFAPIVGNSISGTDINMAIDNFGKIIVASFVLLEPSCYGEYKEIMSHER